LTLLGVKRTIVCAIRTRILGLAALTVLSMVLAAPSSATPAISGYPNSIAALGDSITRAYDADGVYPPGERLQYSWATGTSTKVNSVYVRILAANPNISGRAYNDSASGAKMADLAGQASSAVSQRAQEVVILLGANDACTSSESTMTAVSTFRSEVVSGMNTLARGLPDARIYVVSIPNIYRLWQLLKNNASARFAWSYASICQSLLANPLSTASADVARRAAFLQRLTDFNTRLKQVCALYVHCRFDKDAVFNTSFTTTDVNTLDYFHPSIGGQALLASVAWSSSFNFSDAMPPVSTATVTAVTGGEKFALSATDNVAVSGIEYKIGTGRYHRYTGPVMVSTGSVITWRAVDVNGNSEATHSRTA